MKAFYEGHKSEFMTPEQVVVEYVELKKSSFFDQVKVKQEDLGRCTRRKSPTSPSSAMPPTS